MKYGDKNNHNQVLKPIIGFGWYTGVSSSKANSDIMFKSQKAARFSK